MSNLPSVLVIGAGPAGALATLRAAELGARTTLVTRDHFGGMSANDGPIPVRTLAHAARLLREARQLPQYGITVGEPALDYGRLLARVQEVVAQARSHSSFRAQIDDLGVAVHEQTGTARFVAPNTVATETGLRLEADRIILCAGGKARRIAVPGGELTATHSDAWGLTEVPSSLLVIGAGMTGLQVASIFHAFGSRVQLFQHGPRILEGEDEDVSAEVARALRASGMSIHEGFGRIDSFERTPDGVRMRYTKDGAPRSAEAALAVSAIGWLADTEGLHLPAAGVALDANGFVQVDRYLRTSAPHVYAAGDITGRYMLVPPAVLDGYVAATNAVRGDTLAREDAPNPIGGFTDPPYAHVGLTEAEARRTRDVVVGLARFDETARNIIDGRTLGFCKLVAERPTRRILGCHVVGEAAAEIIQGVAIAMAGGLRVDQLASVPLAYPTYVGTLTRAAYYAARQIDPDVLAPFNRG